MERYSQAISQSLTWVSVEVNILSDALDVSIMPWSSPSAISYRASERSVFTRRHIVGRMLNISCACLPLLVLLLQLSSLVGVLIENNLSVCEKKSLLAQDLIPSKLFHSWSSYPVFEHASTLVEPPSNLIAFLDEKLTSDHSSTIVILE